MARLVGSHSRTTRAGRGTRCHASGTARAAPGRPFHPTGKLNKGTYTNPLAESTPWGLQWLTAEARCPTTPPPGPVYPCSGTGFPGPRVSSGPAVLGMVGLGRRSGWGVWLAGRGVWLHAVRSGLAPASGGVLRGRVCWSGWSGASCVLSDARATRGLSFRTRPLRLTRAKTLRIRANQASPVLWGAVPIQMPDR